MTKIWLPRRCALVLVGESDHPGIQLVEKRPVLGNLDARQQCREINARNFSAVSADQDLSAPCHDCREELLDRWEIFVPGVGRQGGRSEDRRSHIQEDDDWQTPLRSGLGEVESHRNGMEIALPRGQVQQNADVDVGGGVRRCRLLGASTECGGQGQRCGERNAG